MLTSEMLSMLSTCTSMPTGMADPETTAETSHNHDCSSNRRSLRPRDCGQPLPTPSFVFATPTTSLAASACLNPKGPKRKTGPLSTNHGHPQSSAAPGKKSNKNTGCHCGQAGFHYFRPLFSLNPRSSGRISVKSGNIFYIWETGKTFPPFKDEKNQLKTAKCLLTTLTSDTHACTQTFIVTLATSVAAGKT